MDEHESVLEIFQKIYDSEINFAIISPCWDGGFTVVIGPEPYGVDLSEAKCEYRSDGYHSASAAVGHLVDKIVELYPKSTFAKSRK